jgi:hypothetical protein
LGAQAGEGDVLQMAGEHVDLGRPIRVRYVWSATTPTSCRWEQAFSWGGAATWEINLSMDFTRASHQQPSM